jgi:hypothetical protein
MALVLHRVFQDDSFNHSPFTRKSWEDALRDPAVKRRWGHSPERCFDPVEELLAEIKDQNGPVQTVQEAPRREEPAESSEAPPGELTPRLLSEFTTYCLEDCRIMLSPPRPEPIPFAKRGPVPDKKGQYLLF